MDTASLSDWLGVNSFLSSAVVLVALKEKVIQPLLKNPMVNPKDFNNNRPILNLPFLVKVLKNVAASQLLSFLDDNYSTAIPISFQAWLFDGNCPG